ncbi:MAG: D-alanyl-D-alanine carboxypeptidase family protein [Sedimentibacter sp.]
MKKKRKLKIHRILIIITVLIFILFGALLIIEGMSKDKKTPLEEPVGEEPIEEPSVEPVDEPKEPTEEPTEIPEEPEKPVAEEPAGEDIIIVENPGAIDVLVNRTNNLPDTYVPEDLVKLTDVPTVLSNPEINQLRKPAYEALKELFAAAKSEKEFDLYARSGYRSYNTQVFLYSSYVANHGQAAADTFSAKPGQSEHQTGLSMDITCEAMNFQLDDTFGATDEGKWVSENAHRFGFIIRYPKGKEDITGYMYEPWHIRYLGVELATEVYESGLTLEEYFEQ